MRSLIAMLLLLQLLLVPVVYGQQNGWAPYTPEEGSLKLRVRPGYHSLHVYVTFIFRHGGFKVGLEGVNVTNGTVEVYLKVLEYTGPAIQVITRKTYSIEVSPLEPGEYLVVLYINGKRIAEAQGAVYGWPGELKGWRIYSNGVITVAVPKEPKPIYLWWYNGDNSTTYLAFYHGLAEVWLWGKGFNHSLMFSDEEGYSGQILERLQGRISVMLVEENLTRINMMLGKVLRMLLVNPLSVENETRRLVEELKTLLLDAEGLPEDIREDLEKLVEVLERILDVLEEMKGVCSCSWDAYLDELRGYVENATSLRRAVEDAISWARSAYQRLVQLIVKSNRMLHPFTLLFLASKWAFEGPYNITDEEGNVVGVMFSFKLVEAPPGFDFAEGAIEIRNRLYFTAQSNMSVAELKNDIVIEQWEWNHERFRKALGDLASMVPEGNPVLALTASFLALDRRPKEAARIVEGDMQVLKALGMGGRFAVRCGTRVHKAGDMFEGRMDRYKISISSEEELIAGFFRFVPEATVTYPNGTAVKVDVKAFYLLLNRHLKISLLYPYFDAGALEHDPSLGIEGVEEGDAVRLEAAPTHETYTMPAPTTTHTTIATTEAGAEVAPALGGEEQAFAGASERGLSPAVLTGYDRIILIAVITAIILTGLMVVTKKRY